MEAPSLDNLHGPLVESLRWMLDLLQRDIPPGRLSQLQITKLIDGLPRIKEEQLKELGEKDSCPICFNAYLTILTEEEMALAMDTPAHPVEELGVTKLDKPWQCGHVFCRRDISKWITSGHDSCPLCRRQLLEAQSDSQADREPTPEDEAAAEQHVHAYADLSRGMTEIQRLMSANGEAIPEGLFEQFNMNLPTTGVAEAHNEDDRREYSGMYS